MQKWQIHFHSPAKIHIFYITKNKCLLRFHNINIFNISGAEGVPPRGAGVSQGGALVSSAPTKLTMHFYLVGAVLALASGKAERRQLHPLTIHFLLTWRTTTWLVHLRQVHPLKAPPESTP